MWFKVKRIFFLCLTGRKTPTPNKGASGSKTPNGSCAGGDRFIPNRASSNFDLGHYKVNVIHLYYNHFGFAVKYEQVEK